MAKGMRRKARSGAASQDACPGLPVRTGAGGSESVPWVLGDGSGPVQRTPDSHKPLGSRSHTMVHKTSTRTSPDQGEAYRKDTSTTNTGSSAPFPEIVAW